MKIELPEKIIRLTILMTITNLNNKSQSHRIRKKKKTKTQIIAYTGDVALISTSKKKIQKALMKISKEARIRNLSINQGKIKCMVM